MALSVIMALCLSADIGKGTCRVTGSQSFAYGVTEAECSEIANNAINDELLKSGKVGFAYGTCSQRSAYTAVTKTAVEYLKSLGYKVEFKPYTERK